MSLCYLLPMSLCRTTRFSPLGTQQSYEVIEDLLPLHDLGVELKLDAEVKSVCLQPAGEAIDFEQTGGCLHFKVPELLCHRMVVLDYA